MANQKMDKLQLGKKDSQEVIIQFTQIASILRKYREMFLLNFVKFILSGSALLEAIIFYI
ncbi:unnamed protein product [marine sediment metagenome]|uniref:Uncharacterized protein n=1 Tax=marine sediment metagenome TaxID=412755 RepID=X1ARS2_9ZZZZ